MQFLFSLALLLFALTYTGYGLYSLSFFDAAGRFGPGFFPAIVGGLLIVTAAINCVGEYRRRSEDAPVRGTWRDVIEVVVMILVFLVCLPLLGSLLTMLLFTSLFLFRFNPGRHVFNAVYAVLFSAAVFALFDIALQSGLPKGILASLY